MAHLTQKKRVMNDWAKKSGSPFVGWFLAGLLCLLPVQVFATATVNLSYSPATINPGDADQLTISLFNDSTLNGLSSAAITLSLPTGVTVAATPTVVDTCGFGSVSVPANGSLIILSGGSVPQATTTTGIFSDGQRHRRDQWHTRNRQLSRQQLVQSDGNKRIQPQHGLCRGGHSFECGTEQPQFDRCSAAVDLHRHLSCGHGHRADGKRQHHLYRYG